ncbi:hypothetical protein Tco_0863300 [Tanacetum coccineum]
MHNNIMAAGSRDRPPMLATGRYAQWQSHFLRYIDSRSNDNAMRKCILEVPYTPLTVTITVVPAIDDSPEVSERTAVETILNMSPENKEHYQLEKEAIHLLLTRIRYEIYSTVDACKTAHDMWIAIERLQHSESLNIKDVKTNLFWGFGKFTFHDGESMESYYTRFYKMMNEMIRNNLTVAMIQVWICYKKDKNKANTDKTEHREWKEREKTKPKAYTSLMGQPPTLAIPKHPIGRCGGCDMHTIQGLRLDDMRRFKDWSFMDDKPERDGLMAYLPAYAGACRLALGAFQSLFRAKD